LLIYKKSKSNFFKNLKLKKNKQFYNNFFYIYKISFLNQKLPFIGSDFNLNSFTELGTTPKVPLNFNLNIKSNSNIFFKTYFKKKTLIDIENFDNCIRYNILFFKNNFFNINKINLYKFLNFNKNTQYNPNDVLDNFYTFFFKKNFFFKKKYSKFFKKKLTNNNSKSNFLWSNFISLSKIKLQTTIFKKDYLYPLKNYPNLHEFTQNTIKPNSYVRYKLPTNANILRIQKVPKLNYHVHPSYTNKPLLNLYPNFLQFKQRKNILKLGSLFKKNNHKQKFVQNTLKCIEGYFIFQNTGLFILGNLNKNYKSPNLTKFKIKKQLFSFLFPNQIKNNFLKLKKLITLYSSVYQLNFIYNKHLGLSEQTNNLLKLNTKLYQNLEAVNFFNKKNNHITNSPVNLIKINYLNSTQTLSLKEQVTQTHDKKNIFLHEVRIPRVKFKPGYQRLWRNARTALKEALNLHFIYQKQLTKHLVQFFKWTKLYSFSQNELSLEKVVLYSHLIPDVPTFNLFFTHQLVYVNGCIAFSKNFILDKDDLIQLIISKWYYIYYRWLSNWRHNRLQKFKRLIFRKSLSSKYKIIKLRKQKSYYTPNWIFLIKYDISDIKPFLEVDYFTLSASIIYDPLLFAFAPAEDLITYRTNTYRLYNWKYIT